MQVVNVDEVGPCVPCCAVCELPYGQPHKEGCRCTLYEMISVDDYGTSVGEESK